MGDQTLRVEKPFGGKNIDVLCDLFADSIEAGQRDPRLPLLRDSAIASEYAWKFLQNAHMHDLPATVIYVRLNKSGNEEKI